MGTIEATMRGHKGTRQRGDDRLALIMMKRSDVTENQAVSTSLVEGICGSIVTWNRLTANLRRAAGHDRQCGARHVNAWDRCSHA
jgi:hypothetical protein